MLSLKLAGLLFEWIDFLGSFVPSFSGKIFTVSKSNINCVALLTFLIADNFEVTLISKAILTQVTLLNLIKQIDYQQLMSTVFIQLVALSGHLWTRYLLRSHLPSQKIP